MGVELIAGILIVLAIICMCGAAILFFGDRWLIQWLRGTAGFLLAGSALWLVLFAASLFSYQQVSAGETPMATLSFENVGTQAWMVTVAESNGDRRQFRVQGDLWQLDVRMLRYAGLLSALQVTPSFRLERLTGRYLSLEDQADKEHSDHLLLPEPVLGYDLWQRAHDNGSLLLEATRSSIVLLPMAEGAIFEIRLGDPGLAVTPANSVAEDALRRIGA